MNPLSYEPKKITVKNRILEILWNSGETTGISMQKLRECCPCATCLAERSERSGSYIPLFNPDQITVNKILPVGSYAINIIWKDGHNTGIYEFKGLHSMKQE